MVGDFGWEHEGTECQVDTVNILFYVKTFNIFKHQGHILSNFWQSNAKKGHYVSTWDQYITSDK